MVARSHSVTDPRWSPSGRSVAWLASFDGRTDVVVAPTALDEPVVVVTAETGAGGGYCWASDDELVVAGDDGRLVAVAAAGGSVRPLTIEGRAFAPAVSVRGEVACSIERDD